MYSKGLPQQRDKMIADQLAEMPFYEQHGYFMAI